MEKRINFLFIFALFFKLVSTTSFDTQIKNSGENKENEIVADSDEVSQKNLNILLKGMLLNVDQTTPEQVSGDFIRTQTQHGSEIQHKQKKNLNYFDHFVKNGTYRSNDFDYQEPVDEDTNYDEHERNTDDEIQYMFSNVNVEPDYDSFKLFEIVAGFQPIQGRFKNLLKKVYIAQLKNALTVSNEKNILKRYAILKKIEYILTSFINFKQYLLKNVIEYETEAAKFGLPIVIHCIRWILRDINRFKTDFMATFSSSKDRVILLPIGTIMNEILDIGLIYPLRRYWRLYATHSNNESTRTGLGNGAKLTRYNNNIKAKWHPYGNKHSYLDGDNMHMHSDNSRRGPKLNTMMKFVGANSKLNRKDNEVSKSDVFESSQLNIEQNNNGELSSAKKVQSTDELSGDGRSIIIENTQSKASNTGAIGRNMRSGTKIKGRNMPIDKEDYFQKY